MAVFYYCCLLQCQGHACLGVHLEDTFTWALGMELCHQAHAAIAFTSRSVSLSGHGSL